MYCCVSHMWPSSHLYNICKTKHDINIIVNTQLCARVWLWSRTGLNKQRNCYSTTTPPSCTHTSTCQQTGKLLAWTNTYFRLQQYQNRLISSLVAKNSCYVVVVRVMLRNEFRSRGVRRGPTEKMLHNQGLCQLIWMETCGWYEKGDYIIECWEPIGIND